MKSKKEESPLFVAIINGKICFCLSISHCILYVKKCKTIIPHSEMFRLWENTQQ